MSFFGPNIASIARILALLSILANSGFTVVVHYCTMPKTFCCETAGESVHMDCGKGLPLQSAAYTRPDGRCHTDKVIGALTTNPALLQKERTTQNIKLEVASNLALSSGPLSSLSMPSGFFPSLLERDSPLSVEKYVLNGSFLI